MKLFVCFSLSILFLLSCKTNKTADKIYINAIVWTGDSLNPQANAVAIKDSIILYVGNEYVPYADDNTMIIDVNGQMLLPGFIDNHTHFLSGGYQLASIDLRKATTPSEFISIFKKYIADIPPGRWVSGGDWDHEAWGGKLPERGWIDFITGDIPIFVNRYDGHMALANSAALKLAGIDKSTISPAGGVIEKDPESGEPTGILRDEAMSLVSAVIPPLSDKEMDESLHRAVKHAFENGITYINDMGSYGGWPDLKTYQRAYDRKKLDLRIYSFVPLSDWLQLASFIKKNGRGTDMLHWGGLKGFVDGSLGSTTAWFYQPYLDDPSSSGFTITDTTLLRSWIQSGDSSGLHVAVHAIGDHANDMLLNIYQTIIQQNKKDHRFRIEHAQHLTPNAIARFHEMNVIPSMQPFHAIDDGRWASKRLEDARLKGTYAFKSLLSNRARLTFGSDWTVAPLSPLAGIDAAVNRQTLDNKNPGGWYAEQKISVEEALKCYTQNNAYASFMENRTGLVKEGYLADLVILSEDLLAIPPQNIGDVKVMRTIVNGKEVYVNDNRPKQQ